MAFWRKGLFATMQLGANLPASDFGMLAAQVGGRNLTRGQSTAQCGIAARS
jgi:hypothetical protein